MLNKLCLVFGHLAELNTARVENEEKGRNLFESHSKPLDHLTDYVRNFLESDDRSMFSMKHGSANRLFQWLSLNL